MANSGENGVTQTARGRSGPAGRSGNSQAVWGRELAGVRRGEEGRGGAQGGGMGRKWSRRMAPLGENGAVCCARRAGCRRRQASFVRGCCDGQRDTGNRSPAACSRGGRAGVARATKTGQKRRILGRKATNWSRKRGNYPHYGRRGWSRKSAAPGKGEEEARQRPRGRGRRAGSAPLRLGFRMRAAGKGRGDRATPFAGGGKAGDSPVRESVTDVP